MASGMEFTDSVGHDFARFLGLILGDGQCADRDAAVTDLIPIVVEDREALPCAIQRQRGIDSFLHDGGADGLRSSGVKSAYSQS